MRPSLPAARKRAAPDAVRQAFRQCLPAYASSIFQKLCERAEVVVAAL